DALLFHPGQSCDLCGQSKVHPELVLSKKQSGWSGRLCSAEWLRFGCISVSFQCLLVPEQRCGVLAPFRRNSLHRWESKRQWATPGMADAFCLIYSATRQKRDFVF